MKSRRVHFIVATAFAMVVSAAAFSELSASQKASPILPSVYLRWLDEDVRWIITPQERAEFVALSNGKARDRFIADFWARRDPTPGTPENEYKEEHYRRMAYANANFAAALMAGWQTDRGRAYIQLGPPDSRQVRPGMPPSEVWQYNTRVHRTLTFVDECECGEYKLQGPTKREYVP